MRTRKIAAHPLVVAVAFGLIGPDFLEPVAEAEPCMDCETSESEAEDLRIGQLSVDAEEFARVEKIWLEARFGRA